MLLMSPIYIAGRFLKMCIRDRDGSVEVDQRLLQLHQLQEVFVADAFLQLFFGGGHVVVICFRYFRNQTAEE